MARKPQSKSALTDAERHERFVEMAREVEASENPKDFEAAFERLVSKTPPQRPPRGD
jgi:hypothetical protein